MINSQVLDRINQGFSRVKMRLVSSISSLPHPTIALKRKLFLFPCFILLICQSLFAENQGFPDRLNRQFWTHLTKNAASVFSSPFHWGKKDFLTAGLASAGTLTFLPLDEPVHRWLINHPDDFRSSVSRVFSGLSGPAVLLGLTSIGYLLGEVQNSSRTRKAFLLAGESLLLTELMVQSLKTAVGRARPYLMEGAFSFHPLTFRAKWHSFPSGHSAAAWAVATSLASCSKNRYLDLLFYSLASGVSASRVLLDKHYMSDVVAGGLIGYFIAKKITRQSQTPSVPPDKLAISLTPGLRSLTFRLIYYF